MGVAEMTLLNGQQRQQEQKMSHQSSNNVAGFVIDD